MNMNFVDVGILKEHLCIETRHVSKLYTIEIIEIITARNPFENINLSGIFFLLDLTWYSTMIWRSECNFCWF